MNIKKCSVCDSSLHTRKCSGCLNIRYCSTECQKKDWNNHKHKCLSLAIKIFFNKWSNAITNVLDDDNIIKNDKLTHMIYHFKKLHKCVEFTHIGDCTLFKKNRFVDEMIEAMHVVRCNACEQKNKHNVLTVKNISIVKDELPLSLLHEINTVPTDKLLIVKLVHKESNTYNSYCYLSVILE